MVRKKVRRKTKKQKKLSLDSLDFPTYEEVISQIKGRVGKMPELPNSYPKGAWSEQAIRVLEERYLQRDDDGKILETPEEMCWRVAWEIASAEACWGKTRGEVKKIAKGYYKLLISREFLPNSPTLMNAGTGNMLQYSACFVLPVEDSMEGIFDALKYQALIHKTGGGTGFSFSKLRPKGAMVKSSSGIASGPVSFMRIFDAATNEVKQGGKRRGANMGILRVDHPDILEFIRCKEGGGITNFNISVAITDKFMQAYEKGGKYALIDPQTGKKTASLSAKEVFDEIADAAWSTGDPGLVFIDRRNKGSSNPVPSLGPIEATNPCGEQELYPFDACNLGSLFLSYFVKESKGKKEIDWEKLGQVTHTAVRFLDSVIEVNPYPLKQIRQTVLGIRRIGLGVGGWADLLIEMGIPYDSKKALSLAKRVMGFIQEEGVRASQELAAERGTFPLWPISVYKKEKPRRNSTVTTIAPTGTISIIAGTSSGIEPIFALAYQHVVKDKHLDRTLTFINPKLEEVAKSRRFWSDPLMEKIAEEGVIRQIDEIPEDVKANFGTAHEIHHNWHIKMQSIFQKYTENAVSKTINMKNNVKVKDVKDAYLLAWKTNCKGITVFRDGCKSEQVLNLGIKNEKPKGNQTGVVHESIQARPFKVVGATYKLNTPVGTAFVTINEDEKGEPLEVFINVGKAGSDVTAMAEALGRTISTALRFRGQLNPTSRAKEIVDQLAGIGGRRSVGFGPNKVLSLPDAISMALATHFGFRINGNGEKRSNRKYINGNGEFIASGGAGAKPDTAEAVLTARLPVQQEGRSDRPDDPTMASAESGLFPAPGEVEQLFLSSTKGTADICPSCGAGAFVYQEGCAKCHSCGYSEC